MLPNHRSAPRISIKPTALRMTTAIATALLMIIPATSTLAGGRGRSGGAHHSGGVRGGFHSGAVRGHTYGGNRICAPRTGFSTHVITGRRHNSYTIGGSFGYHANRVGRPYNTICPPRLGYCAPTLYPSRYYYGRRFCSPALTYPGYVTYPGAYYRSSYNYYDGGYVIPTYTETIDDIDIIESEERDAERDAFDSARTRAVLYNNTLNDYFDGPTRYEIATPPTEDQTSLRSAPAVPNSASASAEPKPATINLTAGDDAFDRGDYQTARNEYLAAAQRDGRAFGARMALGLAEFALGNVDAAASALRHGVAQYPGLADSSLKLSEVYGQPDDLNRHIEALSKYVDENPTSADARFLQGFIRYFNNDQEQAREDFAAYKEMKNADPFIAEFIRRALTASES